MSTMTATSPATGTAMDVNDATRLLRQGIGACKKLHDDRGFVTLTKLGERMPLGFSAKDYGVKSLSRLIAKFPEHFEMIGAGPEMRVRSRRAK